MRILVLSDGGLGRGFAQRLERDGHDIKWGRPELGTWRPDIVLYDAGREHVKEAESLRSSGFKVIGPSAWSSALESDPNYFAQIVASLGWSLNGIPNGTNFYISGWFNGASFVSTYTSIVYRRFMAGGAGPDLDCTGMLSCFEPITNQTYYTILQPLEAVLKKVNHRGPIHIHAFVYGSKWAIREVYTSLTHPLSLTFFENAANTPSEIVLSLFDETSKRTRTLSRWASGVQLSIPPYPHNYSNEYRVVEGIVPANLKHLWMADMEEDKGKFASAGLIGYVTARGQDESECVRRMYRTVNNIKAPDLQWRNDVGRNIQPLLASLKQGGWI